MCNKNIFTVTPTLHCVWVGVNLGMMENIGRKIGWKTLFGKGRKILRMENSGENFISWAHKFLWEEKLGGKSALNSLGECVE